MLQCATCKEYKPESDFSVDKQYPKRNNRHVWCILCKKAYHKAYSAKWEKANREKRNARRRTKEWHEYMATYRKEHNVTDKQREYHQKRYVKNREQIRKKMDEWRSKNLDTWNGYGRKRRAIMKGLVSEKYSGLDIYARDNGICGICNMPIDLDNKYPDRNSYSVDHIIPIVAGGNDTKDNVQASHLGCNSRKAAHGYKKI